MKLIDLGWCIVKIDTTQYNHKLTIVSPADCADNVYQPAESITIFGQGNLLVLRDALNEIYPQEGA